MFLTATIQTYNRVVGLAEAVRSLAALHSPRGVDYEILVVDNNSSDDTATVIQGLSAQLGSRFRSVSEPRQGLSYARNRAIAEARGEIICFIDDDALADKDWLAAHAEAYRADERVVAAGGAVRLRWPEGYSKPTWLSNELEGYLSGLDMGPHGLVMEYPRYPRGCNMSVRRSVAQNVGGFSVRLGRKGPSLVSNEEKHFFYKVHQHGGRVVYLPEAIAYHVIPETRLSKSFFISRGYAQGKSDLILKEETRPMECSLLWHLRQIAMGVRRCSGALLGGLGAFVTGRWRAAGLRASVRAAHGLGYMVAAVAGLGQRRPTSAKASANPADKATMAP